MEKEILIKKDIIIFSGSNNNELHIAFAVDDAFIRPAIISIISILHSNPKRNFNFHIFTSSVSDYGLGKIKEINIGGSSLTVHLFDEGVFSKYQTLKHLPASMYYRLVIPYALKNVTKQVLYLDADVICKNSIDEMFDIGVGNYVIAACRDNAVIAKSYDYIDKLGVKSNADYFNSGIMLINIEQWIINDVVLKFNSLISKRKYTFPDQDVLNIILGGDVLFLPEKFNTFSNVYNGNCDVVFLHFAGEFKPWISIIYMNDLYMDFYKLSPFCNEKLPLPKNYKECKKYSTRLYKDKCYLMSLRWFFQYLTNKFIKNKF